MTRLSSQVLCVVLRARERCTARGGALKLYGIQPFVGEVFALSGLVRHLEIFLDEESALGSSWPRPPRSCC